jgi:hypothetical protein
MCRCQSAERCTVAIQAEQQYQAGTSPQTQTARTAINDLGNAYNQAKLVYLQVLSAETAFRDATQAQLQACMPASTNASACQSATATANTDKLALDTANATLSSSVNVLVSKTTAVKAIAK